MSMSASSVYSSCWRAIASLYTKHCLFPKDGLMHFGVLLSGPLYENNINKKRKWTLLHCYGQSAGSEQHSAHSHYILQWPFIATIMNLQTAASSVIGSFITCMIAYRYTLSFQCSLLKIKVWKEDKDKAL